MRQGFSLVELSIVLVILGLLTGGILAGQSLIKAAEIRSVISDFQRYHAAFYSFRDKYLAIPGDFNNATAFWGSAGGDGANTTCLSAQSNASQATCNGSGDGQIGQIAGAAGSERFLSWKHLANAGLVQGNYTGKTNGALATYTAVINENVPASKIATGFFDLSHIQTGASNWNTSSKIDTPAILLYGSPAGGYALLKPEDAWNIDVKLDDGSPVHGKVFTTKNTATNGAGCASSDAADAVYVVTNTNPLCLLAYSLR